MSNPCFSLLHATRGRVPMALAARDRWLATAENPDQIEHIFALDRDDKKSVAGLCAYRHVVVEDHERGCVAAWNLAARASHGEILIQLSDDWLPFPGWDMQIIKRFRNLSDPGVLRISDGRRVDDLLCMAIFTRPWLEKNGGDFLSPEYFGVYSDDEFSFLAYEAGVVIDARDIVLSHLHPNYEAYIEMDETHQRQNNEKRLAAGKNIFLRRNPQALRRWIHAWTDSRYFLPPSHRAVCDAAFLARIISNKTTTEECEKVKKQITEMEASLSWRLTTPVRSVQRILGAGLQEKPPSQAFTLTRRIYQKFLILRKIKRTADRGFAGFRRAARQIFDSPGNTESHNRMVKSRIHWRRTSREIAQPPLLDVSFVTFNSVDWIDSLMESLKKQDYPLRNLHLTFVDQGSTDRSLEKLEQYRNLLSHLFQGFHVIKQDNTGYGMGHHRAITKTRNPWLLVSNVDVEFRRDAISSLVSQALSDSDRVAGWETRQFPFEHPKHYDPVTLESAWQAHACVLLRRSAYEKVGGYDPLIFMYGEDVELSYRLRAAGYVLRYCPRSVLTHHTYQKSEDSGKSLQIAGSAVGNAMVRLRYGSLRDKVLGLVLLGGLNLLPPANFRRSVKFLRNESAKVLFNIRHFLAGRGSVNAGFPFRLFDYEMRRQGASYRSIEVSESPFVSIITRTHGARHRDLLLKQAGASVFNQTYKNVEWVVVEDGGETQKSVFKQLLANRPPSAKTLFTVSGVGGRSAAGNFGLEQSSGEFACFLDDDDLLYADHVETLLSALQSKSAVAAYALAFEAQTKFNEMGLYHEEKLATSQLHRQPWDYEVLKDHNFIPIQALLFSRSLFAKRGGFDTSLDQLEDWNLWLRYGFGNSFEYVPKTTSIFRTPADANERAQRQEALHEAYFRAREAAFAALRNLGHQV